MFRHMADGLPPSTSVSCAEYPGISGGKPVGEIQRLATDVAERIAARASSAPVVLLGYCFGAYVAHETARLLLNRGVKVHAVILTGATPPGAQSLAYGDRTLLGRLEDPETMQQLRRIYDPFLQHMTAEEQDRYWSLFKASVEGMRDYAFPTAALPFPCVVLTGANEEYPLIHEHNSSWSEKYENCSFDTIPGGHLMVQTHPAEFVSAVASILDALMVQDAAE
jgi:surfactin synthase thioesterase subunit